MLLWRADYRVVAISGNATTPALASRSTQIVILELGHLDKDTALTSWVRDFTGIMQSIVILINYDDKTGW